LAPRSTFKLDLVSQVLLLPPAPRLPPTLHASTFRTRLKVEPPALEPAHVAVRSNFPRVRELAAALEPTHMAVRSKFPHVRELATAAPLC